MAQIEKQIVSSQKFLNGLASLPHFAELRRKQALRLVTIIRKTSVTVEQSGSILQCLDSSVWDNETMSQLKAALADHTKMEEEIEDKSRRAKQQDYTALPHYLSSEWWRFLEQGKLGEEEKRLSSCAYMQVSWDCKIQRRRRTRSSIFSVPRCIYEMQSWIARNGSC